MNFHGATLPRGWQRTYPHLMTVEAIRGLEYVTFEQKNADEEPTHAAMLPFTRNVFDPMDFTPMVLDRINRIERRTTSAFELALSVLFTSGIQHYAEIPEGMAKAPALRPRFPQGRAERLGRHEVSRRLPRQVRGSRAPGRGPMVRRRHQRRGDREENSRSILRELHVRGTRHVSSPTATAATSRSAGRRSASPPAGGWTSLCHR